jgi:hypothetical protein
MSVIIDTEMSHSEFVRMLMIHLRTEFDMPSLNGGDHSGRPSSLRHEPSPLARTLGS